MLSDIPFGSMSPGGLEISWAVLYFLDCLRGFDSGADGINVVKRLVSFHSMYFAVRVGAIAQEKGCPTLWTVNIATILICFIVFIFFRLCLVEINFSLYSFSCWNHNWQ